jgi:hypothetical protein
MTSVDKQTLTCPHNGCTKTKKVFTAPFLISREERNLDRACKEHKPEFQKVFDEHVAVCRRYGITP